MMPIRPNVTYSSGVSWSRLMGKSRWQDGSGGMLVWRVCYIKFFKEDEISERSRGEV
jgi:hypothetical protein